MKQIKYWLSAIFIVVLIAIPPVYSEDVYYPEVTLDVDGNEIILTHDDRIYAFPSLRQPGRDGIRKVLREDVNGDGVQEYIIGVQLPHTGTEIPYSCVFICVRNGEVLTTEHRVIVGEYFGDVRPFDVDKDGIADLIIEGTSGAHRSELHIVSWHNGKYATLWDAGSASGIFFETDEVDNARIRIGIPLMVKEGWSYADEPDWEIWEWNGKEFVYAQDGKGRSRRERLTYDHLNSTGKQ